MPILEIIRMLMSILAFIAGLFSPKQMSARQVVYTSAFDCNAVRWTQPAQVSGGVFTGTVEVQCEFEGRTGAGILGLRSHLIDQLPKDADMQAAKSEMFRGMPSMAYPTALEMAEGVKARGTTHIATNGFNVVRNVFESAQVDANGAGKYLRGVVSEMEVKKSATEKDVYTLKLTQSMEVKKPALISASEFQSSLKKQAEESLVERAGSAVQESAAHL